MQYSNQAELENAYLEWEFFRLRDRYQKLCVHPDSQVLTTEDKYGGTHVWCGQCGADITPEATR